MRNLKRTLALLVTLVMCLGFVTLPALAAECDICSEDPCETPTECAKARDDADIASAIDLIPAVITIELPGGADAEDSAKGTALKAALDARAGMAELGVTITVEAPATGANPWVAKVNKGTGDEQTKNVTVTFTAPFVPPPEVWVTVAAAAFQTPGLEAANGTAPITDVAAYNAAAIATSDPARFNLTTGDLILGGTFGTAVKANGGFALNGKWQAWDDTRFARALGTLVSRGGTLAVTDKISEKPREGPHKGAAATTGDSPTAAVGSGFVITFSPVQAAARGARLGINYAILANNSGSGTDPVFTGGEANFNTLGAAARFGSWTLSERGKNDPAFLNIEWAAPPAGERKLADDAVWTPLTPAGIAVKGTVAGERQTRDTYFLRPVAHTTGEGSDLKFVAAGRTFRVTANSTGRAPNLRANYKNNTFRARAGQAISVGTGGYVLYGKAAGTTPTGDTVVALSTVSSGIPFTTVTAAENTAALGTLNRARAFTMATDRRPMGSILTVNLAPAAATPTAAPAVSAGRVDRGDFEFTAGTAAQERPADNAKWGNFPKVSSNNAVVWMRVRNTAKQERPEGGIAGFEGNTASAPVRLVVNFGRADADARRDSILGFQNAPQNVTAVTVPDAFTLPTAAASATSAAAITALGATGARPTTTVTAAPIDTIPANLTVPAALTTIPPFAIVWTFTGTLFDDDAGATNDFTWTISLPFGWTADNDGTPVALTGTITVTNFTP